MKPFLTLLLTVIAITLSAGQPAKVSLSDDAAFKQVIAKNLRFPATAVRQKQSVRAYVGFTLAKDGSHQNVSIINLGPIDKSLEQEVDRLWRTLPKQSPTYAGNYVIPLAFLYGEDGPDRLKSISNPADGFSRQGAFTLLEEVSVTGWIVCEKRAMTPADVTVNLPIPKL